MSNHFLPSHFQPFLFTVVGDDLNASVIFQKIHEKGLDTRYIYQLSGISGNASITFDDLRERIIDRHPSVLSNLSKILSKPKVKGLLKHNLIHFKQSFHNWEILTSYQPELFSMDVSGFVKDETFVNQAQNHSKSGFLKDLFQSKQVRYLFGNESEFFDLLSVCGLLDCSEMEFRHNQSIQQQSFSTLRKICKSDWIFLKQGNRGASIFGKNLYLQETPETDLIIKDTTGAGDSFNAGIIFGILHCLRPESILHLGILMGSRKCQFLGAQKYFFDSNSLLRTLGSY